MTSRMPRAFTTPILRIDDPRLMCAPLVALVCAAERGVHERDIGRDENPLSCVSKQWAGGWSVCQLHATHVREVATTRAVERVGWHVLSSATSGRGFRR